MIFSLSVSRVTRCNHLNPKLLQHAVTDKIERAIKELSALPWWEGGHPVVLFR